MKRRGKGQRWSSVSGSADMSTTSGTEPGTTDGRNSNCTSNGWPLFRRQRFHRADRKNSTKLQKRKKKTNTERKLTVVNICESENQRVSKKISEESPKECQNNH